MLIIFAFLFEHKKDARRPYDHFGGGIAPRCLLCVRKQRFPFLKPRCFCAAKILFWGNWGSRGNQPPAPGEPAAQPTPTDSFRESKNPKGKPGWGKMLPRGPLQCKIFHYQNLHCDACFQARRKPPARLRSSPQAGEPSRLAKSRETQAGSPKSLFWRKKKPLRECPGVTP